MSSAEPRYNVLLVSVSRSGQAPDSVVARLAERFSLTESLAAKLVAAMPTPVKKEVTRAVAMRYVEALEALGATAQVVSADLSMASGVLRRAGEPGSASYATAAPVSGAYRSIGTRPTEDAAADPVSDVVVIESDAEVVDPKIVQASSSPIVAELSDPRFELPDETRMLDPDRLRAAGARIEDSEDAHAMRSDLSFSDDLAGFVDGIHASEPDFDLPEAVRVSGANPRVEVGGGPDRLAGADLDAFSLPPQVTGQHAAVESDKKVGEDSLDGFLGAFAGDLASHSLHGGEDSIEGLGKDLGLAGSARASLFDELDGIADAEAPDADGLGIDIQSDPPAPLRGFTGAHDDDRFDDASAFEDAPLELSTRENLEDDILSLSNSYRAASGESPKTEPAPDRSLASERTARPTGPQRTPRLGDSGAARASTPVGGTRTTTPSGTYIATTGSFRPAPRRPAWVVGLAWLMGLGLLGAAGYYGYGEWRARQPDALYAAASTVYEFTETVGDVTFVAACAVLDGGDKLCRYDRNFYRLQFPQATGPALDGAAAACYATLRATPGGFAEDLSCRFRLDRGGSTQKHGMEYHRSFDCGTPLSAVAEGESTSCATSVDLRHDIDGAEQRGGELRGSELYQLRRPITLETPAGFFDALEFVVTREDNLTQRAFWSSTLGVVVRRQDFGGASVVDLTYQRSSTQTGGRAQLSGP